MKPSPAVSRLLLAPLLLFVAACGPDRGGPPAPPLGPEHYVIAPDDVPSPGRHIRYAAAKPGRAGGLDIAITTYKTDDARPDLALVGVVHVADAPYFERLQQELDRYAIVLYEGVKPEDLDNEQFQASFKERGGESALLQRDLASWFGFRFQLDAIDYGRANFVHADMSLEDFIAEGGAKLVPQVDDGAEGKAGEDGAVNPNVRATWQAVRDFGELALGAPGPIRSLARRMFAETMGSTDIGQALEMQPGFSELVLIRRNEVVIERLKEVLPDAEGPIAIFYGAAHMDDLEQRIEKMGYKRADARWLRAWAIRPPLR